MKIEDIVKILRQNGYNQSFHEEQKGLEGGGQLDDVVIGFDDNKFELHSSTYIAVLDREDVTDVKVYSDDITVSLGDKSYVELAREGVFKYPTEIMGEDMPNEDIAKGKLKTNLPELQKESYRLLKAMCPFQAFVGWSYTGLAFNMRWGKRRIIVDVLQEEDGKIKYVDEEGRNLPLAYPTFPTVELDF